MRPNRTVAGGDWRDVHRVATPGARLAGHAGAPPIAFPGWRLAIPGSPPGGQYHGFEAIGRRPNVFAPSATTTPYLSSRHGVALREGETMSDHVYRSPAEMPPRANASGPTNAIESFQEVKEVGFAESPGSYYHNPVPPAKRHAGVGAVATVAAPVVDFPGSVRPMPPIAYPVWGNPIVRAYPPRWVGPINTVPVGPYEPISPSPVVGAPPSAFSPVTAEAYSCQNPDPQCVSAGETCGPFPNGCMPYSESNPDPRCVSEGATGGPWPTCQSAYDLNNPDPKCTASGMTGGPYPNCTALPAVNTSGVDTVTNDPACLRAGMMGGPYPNCSAVAGGASVAAVPTAASGGITAWLGESSIIPGFSNLLVAGGALALLLIMKKK